MTDSTKSRELRERLAKSLIGARPRTPEALWQFIRALYGMAIPRRAVCPGHVAPMDYLAEAILRPGRDLVVWASRGGAKTELGSIAAHLDSIYYPGCQTRFLGGSLDQSEKMYEYLSRKWEGLFGSMLARPPTARRTELTNGSAVEILAQSARSVRGQRVHRLKCDEVDEFSAEVWQAAQFITQSGPDRDGRPIRAQLDVFSTMHRPFGPMAALVDRIQQFGFGISDFGLNDENKHGEIPRYARGDSQGGGPLTLNPKSEIRNPKSSGPLLLTWCLWEVIERCTSDRSCSRCPLDADCGGRARQAEGYFPIDDALAQKARASREAWEAEMLCLRPRGDKLVFAQFDPRRHAAHVAYDAGLPLYRTLDFGYANPFVCLWVQVKNDFGLGIADFGLSGNSQRETAPGGESSVFNPKSEIRNPKWPAGKTPDLSKVEVRVLAEYVARERPIAEHVREMAARDPGPVFATYADPAGWQRSDVTGTGPCEELARLGMRPRTPHAGILEGVELVRRLLKDRPASAKASAGGPGLVIDGSCRCLLRAMQEYHWDDASGSDRREKPAKDGPDHPIDALRYLLAGLFLKRGEVKEGRWW